MLRVSRLSAPNLSRTKALAAACVMACGVACAAPAWADEPDAPKASPRSTVQIGGASVVLIAAKDHIYAYVDSVENNVPLSDGELGITTLGGAKVPMTAATGGLFVGSFDHTGHAHDGFTVSLRSPMGTGEAPAEIIFDDGVATTPGEIRSAATTDIVLALFSAGVGAIGAAIFMLSRRGARRRASARPIGSTHAA